MKPSAKKRLSPLFVGTMLATLLCAAILLGCKTDTDDPPKDPKDPNTEQPGPVVDETDMGTSEDGKLKIVNNTGNPKADYAELGDKIVEAFTGVNVDGTKLKKHLTTDGGTVIIELGSIESASLAGKVLTIKMKADVLMATLNDPIDKQYIVLDIAQIIGTKADTEISQIIKIQDQIGSAWVTVTNLAPENKERGAKDDTLLFANC